MKVHPVNLFAAIVISALLTFGVASLDSNAMKATIAIGGFVFLVTTLSLGIGFTFANARAGVNVKVVSFVFFVGAAILNMVFGIFSFSQTSYIITSGVLFLLYVVIANALFGAQQ
ncbi:MAG TPA: hypothetical protein PLW86_19310 [Rhodocyclaceae bacterium]|nr:hypothetical protein [Rhodocyclaceae bacterium]